MPEPLVSIMYFFSGVPILWVHWVRPAFSETSSKIIGPVFTKPPAVIGRCCASNCGACGESAGVRTGSGLAAGAWPSCRCPGRCRLGLQAETRKRGRQRQKSHSHAKKPNMAASIRGSLVSPVSTKRWSDVAEAIVPRPARTESRTAQSESCDFSAGGQMRRLSTRV